MPAIESRIDAATATRSRRNREHMLGADRAVARAAKSRARDQVGARPSRCSTSAASCCRASASRACSTSARPGSSCARSPATASTRRTLEKSVPGGGMIAGIGYVVRRALHGGRRATRGIDAGAIQPMGLREDPARAGDRAREQAALRAPGRVRRRQPAALPRRGLRPRRRDLPQPGAAVGRRHSGDHRACTARPRRAAPTCRACPTT